MQALAPHFASGRPLTNPSSQRALPQVLRRLSLAPGQNGYDLPRKSSACSALASASPKEAPSAAPPLTFTHWAVDEYGSRTDSGYTRVTVEDQFSFITQELELSPDQTLYLLFKMGLIDEEAVNEWHGNNSEKAPVLESTEEAEPHEPVNGFSVEVHPDFGLSPDALQQVQHETQARLAAASAIDLQDTRVEPGAGPSGRDHHSSQQHSSGHQPVQPVYDPNWFHQEYEVITLPVIGRRSSTAAAKGVEIELAPGRVIAGRYQVLEQVGAAAFSRAVQALDMKEDRLVCLKVVKNDKESLDACLEEIRLLSLINSRDPNDSMGIIRLVDYFYYLGHLFLVVELLGGNLYDTQVQDPTYFTAPRVQSIARQALRSLDFLHRQEVIHADIKPENILVKDYKKCTIKVIDLGCSIYRHESRLTHYVQSRSYRAPEVMMGLPYDGRIDIWSLGCVLAELVTGQVLFPAVTEEVPGEPVVPVSEAAMLSRMQGMLGPFPEWMLQHGSYAGAFFTRSGQVYERCPESGLFQVLVPKRTSLAARIPEADRAMLHFISSLLNPDPMRRPSAEQALRHPWLSYKYRTHS